MKRPQIKDARGQWSCTDVTKTSARWERNRSSTYIEERFEPSGSSFWVASVLTGGPVAGRHTAWGNAVKRAIELNNLQVNEAKRILADYDYID